MRGSTKLIIFVLQFPLIHYHFLLLKYWRRNFTHVDYFWTCSKYFKTETEVSILRSPCSIKEHWYDFSSFKFSHLSDDGFKNWNESLDLRSPCSIKEHWYDFSSFKFSYLSDDEWDQMTFRMTSYMIINDANHSTVHAYVRHQFW